GFIGDVIEKRLNLAFRDLGKFRPFNTDFFFFMEHFVDGPNAVGQRVDSPPGTGKCAVDALEHDLQRDALFFPVFNEDPVERRDQRKTLAFGLVKVFDLGEVVEVVQWALWIQPPPITTSSQKKTAPCPGVTARCGASNSTTTSPSSIHTDASRGSNRFRIWTSQRIGPPGFSIAIQFASLTVNRRSPSSRSSPMTIRFASGSILTTYCGRPAAISPLRCPTVNL